MYRAKDNINEQVLKGETVTKVAEIIGLSRGQLSQVLNQSKICSKLVAYCITKYTDSDLEIDDLFDRVED